MTCTVDTTGVTHYLFGHTVGESHGGPYKTGTTFKPLFPKPSGLVPFSFLGWEPTSSASTIALINFAVVLLLLRAMSNCLFTAHNHLVMTYPITYSNILKCIQYSFIYSFTTEFMPTFPFFFFPSLSSYLFFLCRSEPPAFRKHHSLCETRLKVE